jgi:hypothetical protein
MSGRALFRAMVLVAPMVMALSGCPSVASGGPDEISITASSGILTAGASGTWTFDTGYVATNTADVITFTVKNTTSRDFSATASTFTNHDFSDSITGTFTVPAGQSASFTGTFKPTFESGTLENDTLTLTPSSGGPMVLQLQGTSGPPSFLSVLDVDGFPIEVAAGDVSYGDNESGRNVLTINNLRPGETSSHTITLTGNPPVRITNTADFALDAPAPATLIDDQANTVFGINSMNPAGGATTTVTFGGQDSLAGEFFFTFTVEGAPFIGQ